MVVVVSSSEAYCASGSTRSHVIDISLINQNDKVTPLEVLWQDFSVGTSSREICFIQ